MNEELLMASLENVKVEEIPNELPNLPTGFYEGKVTKWEAVVFDKGEKVWSGYKVTIKPTKAKKGVDPDKLTKFGDIGTAMMDKTFMWDSNSPNAQEEQTKTFTNIKGFIGNTVLRVKPETLTGNMKEIMDKSLEGALLFECVHETGKDDIMRAKGKGYAPLEA